MFTELQLPKLSRVGLLLVSDLLQAELHVGVLVADLDDSVPHQLNEHLGPQLLQGLIFHVDGRGLLHQVFHIHLAELLLVFYFLLRKGKFTLNPN